MHLCAELGFACVEPIYRSILILINYHYFRMVIVLGGFDERINADDHWIDIDCWSAVYLNIFKLVLGDCKISTKRNCLIVVLDRDWIGTIRCKRAEGIKIDTCVHISDSLFVGFIDNL